MLRGNYAGEIALAIAALPQAAKTPSVGPEQVRPVVTDTTGTLIKEGHKLPVVGEVQPQVVSARAAFSSAEAGKPIGPALSDAIPDIEIAPYGKMVRSQGVGQAHHLNQDAAFKSVIKTSDGLAIRLEGNAFTDIGSPHYQAHRSLEAFYNQFRKGGTSYGEVPTNLQYSKALLTSLREAGLTAGQAKEAVRSSIKQRIEAGQLGRIEIPRVPNRINQAKEGLK